MISISITKYITIMNKLVQKLTVLSVAVMPVLLCGCPGASYVDNDPSPKGYVVKMKNDYSDKVMVTMFISSANRDTSFCCASTENHTINISNDFYNIKSARYEDIVYTSIKSEKWNESLLDSLSNYIIGIAPFDEVYAYYKNYSIEELKNIVEHNELTKFERLK